MALDPSKTSSEYESMRTNWTLISDIMEGAHKVRGAKMKYLPKYERESLQEYYRRNLVAPWRPEFTDILASIASKPFGKDVQFKGSPPDIIRGVLNPETNERDGGLFGDIDGRGNNLTTFAREAFTLALANGMHAILVDYPDIGMSTTIAQEREIGARPYWINIPAPNILALYTDMVGGREIITHVRIKESIIVRDEWNERIVERVRIFEPGHWELWERDLLSIWARVGEGVLNRGGKTEVPLALFFPGTREGTQKVKPPLIDLANMQIELYQALSRQEEILTFAGSPMLAANGMSPPIDGSVIDVGPRTVLFAPTMGTDTRPKWEFVQPDASNIAEIRNHVVSIQNDMRRIGMQPLTEQTGNPTATGQSISSARAHIAIKAWALMMNDVIEQAFVYTCEWLGLPTEIETEISTDFSVMPYSQHPLQSLAAARGTRDLSRYTYLDGLKRFDVLPADFDYEAEQKRIKDEIASGETLPAQEVVQVRV